MHIIHPNGKKDWAWQKCDNARSIKEGENKEKKEEEMMIIQLQYNKMMIDK